MTVRWGVVLDKGKQVRFAATCDHCESIVSAHLRNDDPERVSRSERIDLSSVKRAVSESQQEVEWWPKVGDAPEVKDVPEAIARAAREAYSSANVGNHMASILMARTVIEASAKNKGITDGSLFLKINAMKEQNLIRPAIAEQAHEVRFAGNDMAHGDIDVTPEAVDSEEILVLMAEMIREVFQGPAQLKRIQEEREKSERNK